MVIGQSQFNMESARTFSASSTTLLAKSIGTASNNIVDATKTVQGITTSFSESKGTAAKDSFKASLDTYKEAEELTYADENTLSDKGFSLRERNLRALQQMGKSQNKIAARKVMEHTLLYLLIRLKRLFTSDKDFEDDSMSPSFDWSASEKDFGNSSNNNIISMSYGSNRYEENESMSFETRGKVITADGRELDFGVSLSLSRSFSKSVERFSKIEGSIPENFVDPLVINLDCNPTVVSDQKFYFDLDADGKEEEISSLARGNGFIALDKNSDGIINDGSELFGTKSGDGFKDLAAYDLDGNGWIDEADEIFDKLLIWTKDEEGNDKLYKLKEVGVGAICLESVNSGYSLKDENNQAEAIIRHTGFFLYENGEAGTLMHLDMAT